MMENNGRNENAEPVKIWARVGIRFAVDGEKLLEIKKLIQGDHLDEARAILRNAMIHSYEFCGESYIPDNDDCIGGVDVLRDFDF